MIISPIFIVRFNRQSLIRLIEMVCPVRSESGPPVSFSARDFPTIQTFRLPSCSYSVKKRPLDVSVYPLYPTLMDIEKLSKAQLVMLALLVSFMTSMSTGIVTVALMQQAPPSITQSVSKVVERTIATDTDESLDAELVQSRDNQIKVFLLFRVHKIARRPDQRTALGRVEFGNFLKERIEENVRDAWIKKAVEAFDKADDLDPELVRAHHRARNSGVKCGRVAAGGEDADAFHGD